MIGAVLGAASLLVLHGTEEYVTGLYEVDPLFKRVAASLPFDAHFEFLAYINSSYGDFWRR